MFALRAVRGPSLQPTSSLGSRRGGPFAAPVSEPDPATIWHRFRTEARRAVSESTWHIWLERVSFRELAGTTLVLEAPDDVRSWVETRFGRLLGAPRRDRHRAGRARGDRRARGAAPPPQRPRPEAQRAAAAQELNPRLTFDQFVIGDCNRLAHAAALAVAEMPGPGLQPALHLRPARARQDPPAALDRQLRARARRRPDRPLHDRRGVHRPLRRRAPGRRPGGVQGRLPRRRRPARRRRPVPAEQGQDRAGVLPHLQRAAPGRRPARADLRPPAARHGGARGPAARALRGRPGVRRAPARARHAPDDPAQARRPGRRRRGRPRARSS